ncbi:MAG: prenyltransferase/squalene oxidase repeat-containing protein, partial [Pirellulales bacterium]
PRDAAAASAAPAAAAAREPAAGTQAATMPAASQTKAATAQPASSQAATARGRSPALEQLEQLDRVGRVPMTALIPAWLVSALVHMIVLLVFGAWVMPPEVKQQVRDLVAMAANVPEPLDEIKEETLEDPVKLDLDSSELTSPIEAMNDAVDISDSLEDPAPLASVELSDIGIETAPASELLSQIGALGEHGLAGRGDDQRKVLVARRGGSDSSEAAVAAALQWFANHQNADGSWSFDHRGGKCQGRCRHPGNLKEARLAATGMALLPFLGAGQTHKQGKYKDQVRGGLYFLISNMVVTPNGGDMTGGGGRMYGHGIATIALCEAYAMTQDKQLMAPAQQALNFIMYAQDHRGGGWRYMPHEAGDTSVVGWQVMALKSGHLGFLQVNPQTVKGAYKFLDSVQIDGGADYGYTTPEFKISEATRAIGLLCRMHLGWKRENPAMEQGVQAIANLGPSPSDMYYNYYATQVMHHYEGPLWDAWNAKMRDSLVKSQAKEGHEKGSWVFDDHGFDAGGRVYGTSMAAMTLEVYYRHMPIYAQKSAEAEFDE